MAVHVLHLSDIHLTARPGARVYDQDADANLRRVVAAARRRRDRYDAVVVTGDVAEDASPEAYERALAAVRPLADVFRWVPGNHDDRAAMAAVDEEALGPATVGPWRLVTFDSQWPGHVPGCRTIGVEPLRDAPAAAPDVRAVLSGHLHRSFVQSDGAGTTWAGAPSTCVQALHPSHVFTAEPPAAHTMTWHDDGTVLVAPIQA
jgi:Icc protein